MDLPAVPLEGMKMAMTVIAPTKAARMMAR